MTNDFLKKSKIKGTRTKSVRSELDTRQPTMRRAKTSMTKAT